MNELISMILNHDMKKLMQEEMYIEVRSILLVKIKDFLKASEFKEALYQVAEENFTQAEQKGKTFKEVMPKGFENSLKVLVYNKGPEIAEGAKSFIDNDNFEVKLKEEINKFAKGLNPMVAKFVNVDAMSNKIIISILSYFDNTDNNMKLIMELNNKIDIGVNKSVGEITNYIPYEGKRTFIKESVDMLLNLISEELIVDKIEENFNKYSTVGELLSTFGITEEKILKK